MEDKCILCGKTHAAGLNIFGCFLCFPCEQSLLSPVVSLTLSKKRRRKLLKLYGWEKDMTAKLS